MSKTKKYKLLIDLYQYQAGTIVEDVGERTRDALVKALNTQYAGKKVKAKDINYGGDHA